MAEGVTPKELDIELHGRVPDGQWEIVDVAFPATAHADFQIPHSMSPENAEQVEYTVLRQSTPGTIYEDRSATRTKWSPGFITLRSDTGGWTGRLLLRVLKKSLVWFPGQNIVYTPPVVGILGVADGGTGADLSATGPGYLKQAGAGSAVTVASSIPAGDIGSGQLALARGGTHADLSATGGTSQFLKQASAGADITVARPAISDLSDAASVVVTGGSYADPAWLTTLNQNKLRYLHAGAPVTGAAGTGEQDLQSVSLPAGMLAADGDSVHITAVFSAAANGNNKTFKLYFGATLIGSYGPAAANDQRVSMFGNCIRTGSATQYFHGGLIFRSAVPFSDLYASPTATLANAVTIKTTGQGGTTGADITSLLLVVEIRKP